jgi:hypothetical protein
MTLRGSRVALLSLIALTTLADCSSAPSPSVAAATVAVDVQPAAAQVRPAESVSFVATVTGTVDTTVRWSVTPSPGGTIDATGRYVAPSAPGTYQVVATSNADPRFSGAATVTVSDTTNRETRPSWNTGDGFFVKNGRLYDRDGYEFIPKGFNGNHADESWATCSGGNCGLENTGANALRWFDISFGSGTNIEQSTIDVTNMLNANHMVSMPVCAYTEAGDTTNTNNTTLLVRLTACVDKWVNPTFASFYQSQERRTLINLANEWGWPCDENFRTAYRNQITRMRNAGYKAPLVIDIASDGYDLNCPGGGAAFLQSLQDFDPQHNLVFSYHLYVADADTEFGTLEGALTLLEGLRHSTSPYGGPAAVMGEFGPFGAFSNTHTRLDTITRADAHGIGWLAWAWDDNGGSGCGMYGGAPAGACFAMCANPGGCVNAFTLITSGPATGEPANCTVPGPCTTSPCNCTRDSTLSSYNNYENQAVILDLNHGLFHVKPPKASASTWQ